MVHGSSSSLLFSYEVFVIVASTDDEPYSLFFLAIEKIGLDLTKQPMRFHITQFAFSPAQFVVLFGTISEVHQFCCGSRDKCFYEHCWECRLACKSCGNLRQFYLKVTKPTAMSFCYRKFLTWAWVSQAKDTAMASVFLSFR